MARFGLSESMRSTASIEDIEPLMSTLHRQPLRRPRPKLTAKLTSAVNEQKKTSGIMHFNPLLPILGGVLAVLFLITANKVLEIILRTCVSNHMNSEAQFEQLERSIQRLSIDTANLQTTANRFLQSCQEVQVAASTRTEMLQIALKNKFFEK